MASLSGPGVSETKTEHDEDLDYRHGIENELNRNDALPDEELEKLFQDCKDFITKLEMEEKSELSKNCKRTSEPKWKKIRTLYFLQLIELDKESALSFSTLAQRLRFSHFLYFRMAPF